MKPNRKALLDKLDTPRGDAEAPPASRRTMKAAQLRVFRRNVLRIACPTKLGPDKPGVCNGSLETTGVATTEESVPDRDPDNPLQWMPVPLPNTTSEHF
jgi:hypothetical protein